MVDQRIDIIEKLEQGQISAQAASQMLEAVDHGAWARLVPKAETSVERRHLRRTVLLLVLGSVYASFVFSYAFLWTVSPGSWPPRPWPAPQAGLSALGVLG